ncbi:MAG: MBL fold metallo-hydrolase [Selenomonadaceae bacterium]|nr:MBL fold metallo-hydrolase [Selenomonadaceae bacterium]
MEIVYLLNSGFMIKDEKTLILIDDYDDPEKIVDRVIAKETFENLYILVSHAHFDHFGTHIRAYAPQTSRYIFSNDIKHTKRIKMFPADLVTFMKKYSFWEGEGIKISTYDSTDVGLSFLIETATGIKIFHAGDFNWWHWENDTPEQKNLAEKTFKKQLKKMQNLEVDVAFFPVDGRLGEAQEKGVTEFVKQVEVKNIVAMHRVGYPAWIPSRNFTEIAPADIKIWSPTISGDKRIIVDSF